MIQWIMDGLFLWRERCHYCGHRKYKLYPEAVACLDCTADGTRFWSDFKQWLEHHTNHLI